MTYAPTNELRLSQLKEIRSLLGDDNESLRSFVDQWASGETYFTVDDYLFLMNDDAAVDVLVEQYEHDHYMIGCFTTWALADATEIDASVFEALHEAEQFEAAGKIVTGCGALRALMELAISGDGIGHMLNSYDGSEIELDCGWIAVYQG